MHSSCTPLARSSRPKKTMSEITLLTAHERDKAALLVPPAPLASGYTLANPK